MRCGPSPSTPQVFTSSSHLQTRSVWWTFSRRRSKSTTKYRSKDAGRWDFRTEVNFLQLACRPISSPFSTFTQRRARQICSVKGIVREWEVLSGLKTTQGLHLLARTASCIFMTLSTSGKQMGLGILIWISRRKGQALQACVSFLTNRTQPLQ